MLKIQEQIKNNASHSRKKYQEHKLVQRISMCMYNYIYSPSCLGLDTAKGPCRSSSQAAICQLSTTHDGDFILSLELLNVK